MIRLQNVCLNYDGGPNILENIDLALDEGSFHFLTGPSGAGKTSLLKLIFLAHRPSAGQLDLFVQNVNKLTRAQLAMMRRQIGVVFQDFRLIDHLSVYQNVTLPLRIAGKREATYRDNVTELLRWLGLGHQMNTKPEHYRAAKNNAPRSPAPSSRARASLWPTNRPVMWIRKWVFVCYAC